MEILKNIPLSYNKSADIQQGVLSVASGGLVGYVGLDQGLHRALGIRLERHFTPNENVDSILKNGLDPKKGGLGGWSNIAKVPRYVENSKGFVHVTGVHPQSKLYKDELAIFSKRLNMPPSLLNKFLPTYLRIQQEVIYKSLHAETYNLDFLKSVKNLPPMEKNLKTVSALAKGFFSGKTAKFFVPGTDDYYTKNFIPDVDDVALKTKQTLKVYQNKFEATFEGLKKFGLTGIKQKPSRVVAGFGLLSSSAVVASKLVSLGVEKIKNCENLN